nr:glycosyltransferase [Marinobacter sp. ATCH36]
MITKRKGILRYIILTFRTVNFLIKSRPTLVFCQNPSVVLSFLCVILKPIFRYNLIVDRHSSFRFETRNHQGFTVRIFHAISDYTIRKADLTIVTNLVLAKFIKICGGRPFVLPDPLPIFDQSPKEGDYFVFISSMGLDENLHEVLSAFRAMPNEKLYVTGNYEAAVLKGDISLCDLPDNIELTGFVPESDYVDLISRSKSLIVYTSNEYTITCGAYEAVAICKPMILSNTSTISKFFSGGAVYVSGDVESFMSAVREVRSNEEKLKNDVGEFKSYYIEFWRRLADDFEVEVRALNFNKKA